MPPRPSGYEEQKNQRDPELPYWAVNRKAAPVPHERLPHLRMYPLKKPPGLKEFKRKIDFPSSDKENARPTGKAAGNTAGRPTSASRTQTGGAKTHQPRRSTSAPKGRKVRGASPAPARSEAKREQPEDTSPSTEVGLNKHRSVLDRATGAPVVEASATALSKPPKGGDFFGLQWAKCFAPQPMPNPELPC